MTNTKQLRKKIEASGLKMQYIAGQLQISRAALTMKLENRSDFRQAEIVKLCELLGIEAPEEKNLIFLSEKLN